MNTANQLICCNHANCERNKTWECFYLTLGSNFIFRISGRCGVCMEAGDGSDGVGGVGGSGLRFQFAYKV